VASAPSPPAEEWSFAHSSLKPRCARLLSAIAAINAPRFVKIFRIATHHFFAPVSSSGIAVMCPLRVRPLTEQDYIRVFAVINTFVEYKRFEDIKRIRDDGGEYWFARELALVLDYTEWRNFTKVINKAMIACNNSGHDVVYDFVEVNKIVDAGATSKPVNDYELSRYACYLIVQNGDPRKEVIALGQTYFAIQTYRQEIADRFNQLDEDSRRLVVRGDIKQWNQLLAEAARDAGVITNEEFALFQNAELRKNR